VSAVAKRNLSSELLHDLRTPLNQIIGYSDMLAEEATEPTGITDDLQKISSAGKRMLQIIDENFTAGLEKLRTVQMSVDARPRVAIPTLQTAIDPGVILVVDDDESNRDVLSRRLTRQGHTVKIAHNGTDALSLMADTVFDVVLLDIMMPDIDGYEVLRRIKTSDRLHHTAVIMISAVNEVQSVVRCIQAGAEDYLTKPFDATLLKARVDSSLMNSRLRAREATLFAQLQENFHRLQELEKLRDDMRNMIVHDLRTPLTSVIAGIEMVNQCGPLTQTQEEMIGIGLTGAKTLLGMINDLLDVEKMEAGKSHVQDDDVSAAALVADAIAQVASLTSQSGTTIVDDVRPDLPRFRGDEKKLGRTLVNLIANAIKFTGAGTVTITASATDEQVLFAVRDSGPGIAPEAFERIFEKFGQVDSHSKVGTGLGLAFCKLAVEEHHGHIAVESTLGAGSTFTFTIPRVGAISRD
jgi:two-component system, sensor histidine kinase and response regulator